MITLDSIPRYLGDPRSEIRTGEEPSPEEVAVVKAAAGRRTARQVAEELAWSIRQVERCARSLRVRLKPEPRKPSRQPRIRELGMTGHEKSVLRSMAGKFSIRQIAEAMGWTIAQTRHRAKVLNLNLNTRRFGKRTWETWKEDYIIRHHGTLTLVEIAANLQIPYHSVCYKARHLGMEGRGVHHRTRDSERIREQVKQQGPALLKQGMVRGEIARHLGVSASTVYRHLGRVPKLEKTWRAWTTKEDALLQTHYGKVSIAELGRMLGRSVESVSNRIHTLGLYVNPGSRPELRDAVTLLLNQGLSQIEVFHRMHEQGQPVSLYFIKKWSRNLKA